MRITAKLRALERATRPYDTAFAAAMERRWKELPDTAKTPGQILGRHGVGLRGHPRRLPQVQPQVHPLLPLQRRQPGTRRRPTHPRTDHRPDAPAARTARPTRPHPAHRR